MCVFFMFFLIFLQKNDYRRPKTPAREKNYVSKHKSDKEKIILTSKQKARITPGSSFFTNL